MIKKKATDYDIVSELKGSDLFLFSQEVDGEYITKNVAGSDIKAYTAFDAATATHEGTTTGGLNGAITVKQMADVVDLDLMRLANTSGTNTGDQDLSSYALTENIPAPDNLGNHTATMNIDLSFYSLSNVSSIVMANGATEMGTVSVDTEANLLWAGNNIITSANQNPLFNPDNENHGGTTAGRLAGTTKISEFADAFDSLVVAAGKDFCLPFTYMHLSKCFTTGSIGWITEEMSGANYYYSAGGFESAAATLQNGTSYLEFVLPNLATEFATTNCFELYFIGNSLLNTEAKYDLTIYATKYGTTGKTNLYSATGQTVSSTTVPTHITIDKAGLLTNLTTASLTTGFRRIVIELEFYSKSSKSIKLMQGAINLIG